MCVTTKGQVTIPLHIRKKMGIAPASEVEFIVGDDDRVYVEKVSNGPAEQRFSRPRGVATVKLSTEEIMKLTRTDE